MNQRALKRSLQDFRRHPWLHLVTISTIVVSLLILGAFFLCYRNLETLANRTNPSVMGTIYLKDDFSVSKVEHLKNRILALRNLSNVVFKEKESVMAELQEFLGHLGTDIVPGADLFPNVIEVELNNRGGRADLMALTKIITRYPEVSEVDFSEDWIAHYKDVRAFFNAFGMVLMFTIVFGCTFITANFMGIRHQTRREEIDIVRLIGAPRKFVLMPYVWEGLIEGAIASSVAVFVLFIGKALLTMAFPMNLGTILGIKQWLFLSVPQALVIMSMGLLMACLGSVTVLFRFREKRS